MAPIGLVGLFFANDISSYAGTVVSLILGTAVFSIGRLFRDESLKSLNYKKIKLAARNWDSEDAPHVRHVVRSDEFRKKFMRSRKGSFEIHEHGQNSRFIQWDKNRFSITTNTHSNVPPSLGKAKLVDSRKEIEIVTPEEKQFIEKLRQMDSHLESEEFLFDLTVDSFEKALLLCGKDKEEILLEANEKLTANEKRKSENGLDWEHDFDYGFDHHFFNDNYEKCHTNVFY